MSNFFIDYGKLIDDAMHVIVKQALGFVENGSLPGKHHFFISFLTSYPGVEISDALRARYPEEMTIVLQHQFEDLQVTDKQFSVILSFDNVKERITIPFDSLVAFADPSVKFGLQFSHVADEHIEEETIADIGKTKAEKTAAAKKEPENAAKKEKAKTKSSTEGNNVVDIDAFRKK